MQYEGYVKIALGNAVHCVGFVKKADVGNLPD